MPDEVIMAKPKHKQPSLKQTLIIVVAIVLIAAIVVGVLWYTGYLDDVISKITALIEAKNKGDDKGGNAVKYDGTLTVHYIDVGQGDCILICFPDGKEMLIDCANYNNSQSIQTKTLNYLSTYITDGQIDYLMLTHCDSDHVYFMDDVLAAYDVDNIYMPNVKATPTNTTL